MNNVSFGAAYFVKLSYAEKNGFPEGMPFPNDFSQTKKLKTKIAHNMQDDDIAYGFNHKSKFIDVPELGYGLAIVTNKKTNDLEQYKEADYAVQRHKWFHTSVHECPEQGQDYDNEEAYQQVILNAQKKGQLQVLA